MPMKPRPPLLVVVSNGRWDAYGVPSYRNEWLMQLLRYAGGINESVPDGVYHFNAKWRWTKVIMSLDPATE